MKSKAVESSKKICLFHLVSKMNLELTSKAGESSADCEKEEVIQKNPQEISDSSEEGGDDSAKAAARQ